MCGCALLFVLVRQRSGNVGCLCCTVVLLRLLFTRDNSAWACFCDLCIFVLSTGNEVNRLTYWITAKTKYNIQSPYLFELYERVIAPRLSDNVLKEQDIERGDVYRQLVYKLCDYYKAVPVELETAMHGSRMLRFLDGSGVCVVESPHRGKCREEMWETECRRKTITLSVDLFDVGLLFANPKLSKQHFVLR